MQITERSASPRLPAAPDGVLPSDIVGGGAGWFPVLTAARLAADPGPHPLTLFGRQFVAWAAADGEPAVTARRCPHRRADLAGGQVGDGTLQCPYHGWRFDRRGSCVLIPQLPTGTPAPGGADVATLATQVRWGMVWVWGDPDRAPGAFPTWPEVDGAADGGDRFEVFVDRVERWDASALRVVDNLLDTAHPAFVHVATFGDPSRAEVAADALDPTPDGFTTTIRERSAAAQTGTTEVRVTLSELIGPFTVRTRAYTGPDGAAGPADFALWTVAVPVDDATTDYVRLHAVDPRRPRDLDALRQFSARVLAEDRPIVEGLEQPLPLSPGAEIHLRADRPTILYRRYLAALQRGEPWPTPAAPRPVPPFARSPARDQAHPG